MKIQTGELFLQASVIRIMYGHLYGKKNHCRRVVHGLQERRILWIRKPLLINRSWFLGQWIHQNIRVTTGCGHRSGQRLPRDGRPHQIRVTTLTRH